MKHFTSQNPNMYDADQWIGFLQEWVDCTNFLNDPQFLENLTQIFQFENQVELEQENKAQDFDMIIDDEISSHFNNNQFDNNHNNNYNLNLQELLEAEEFEDEVMVNNNNNNNNNDNNNNNNIASSIKFLQQQIQHLSSQLRPILKNNNNHNADSDIQYVPRELSNTRTVIYIYIFFSFMFLSLYMVIIKVFIPYQLSTLNFYLLHSEIFE